MPSSGGSVASSAPGTRYIVPGCGSGGRCVDDHHAFGAAHLESDVHARRAAVDQPEPVGHTSFPQVAHQDRADAVVAAQQVAAADDQDRTTRRVKCGVDHAGLCGLVGRS